MAKSGRKSPVKGIPVLNPQGVARSKRSVWNLDACLKIQKYAQGIIHNRVARGHTAVFDTEPHQSMVVIGGWEIAKHHDTWTDAQGVNMGGYLK